MVDIDDAFATVAAAIRAHGEAPAEVISGLDMLRGSVTRWLSGANGALRAPRHGRWVVAPSGAHIDLVRRPTLRRLIHALVDARVLTPGAPRSATDLIAAGWPDESADLDAATNRLRVALCRLRQLGLDSLIVTTSRGWMINPNVPVALEDEEPAPEAVWLTRHELPKVAQAVWRSRHELPKVAQEHASGTFPASVREEVA